MFDARRQSSERIERKCAERPGPGYPFSVRFSARGKDYALVGKGVKSGSEAPGAGSGPALFVPDSARAT